MSAPQALSRLKTPMTGPATPNLRVAVRAFGGLLDYAAGLDESDRRAFYGVASRRLARAMAPLVHAQAERILSDENALQHALALAVSFGIHADRLTFGEIAAKGAAGERWLEWAACGILAEDLDVDDDQAAAVIVICRELFPDVYRRAVCRSLGEAA
jgi:hypothetical protein